MCEKLLTPKMEVLQMTQYYISFFGVWLEGTGEIGSLDLGMTGLF